MIFSNLDESGDWTFGSGQANYTELDIAIGLNIKTRIYSWVDDCFFDMDAGIDWTNRLGSKNQDDLLETDLRRIILQSEGVTGILSFDIVKQGRKFNATYEITTVYSQSFRDSVTLGAFNA